jgi:hypothetical protein
MSISQEIKRKIDESDMEFTQEQKFELITIIDNAMKEYVPIKHIKKDVINIIDIFTGMMPRQRADEHIKKISSSDLMNKFSADGYDMVYIGTPESSNGTKVNYLEKGKLNVIELSLGMMPKPRAEQYLNDMNDNFKKIKEFEDYNVTFHGYRENNFANFKEG